MARSQLPGRFIPRNYTRLVQSFPSNFINIFLEILNQVTKGLILFGKPPGFKRNLGRFVGLKGSTVTFVMDGLKFTMDRPHPRRECGKGLVKRVREYLRKCGKL